MREEEIFGASDSSGASGKRGKAENRSTPLLNLKLFPPLGIPYKGTGPGIEPKLFEAPGFKPPPARRGRWARAGQHCGRCWSCASPPWCLRALDATWPYAGFTWVQVDRCEEQVLLFESCEALNTHKVGALRFQVCPKWVIALPQPHAQKTGGLLVLGSRPTTGPSMTDNWFPTFSA